MRPVDVVVVAYNSRQCLRACVEPLTGIPGVSVLVVDNACPERSFEVVEELAGVRVIHTPRNGGFAYGCNRGWRSGSSDLVLFLNPDARLEAASLSRLAHVLDVDPTVGAVGPRTHREDGTLAWSIRRYPSLRSTYARALFVHHLAPQASWTDEVVRDPALYDRTTRVDWLPATSLLVRRSTLEAVAGFDEAFFMYVEDMDLCWRIRRTGLDIVYTPDAVCMHEGGRSFPRAGLLPTLAASRLHYAKLRNGPIGRIAERAGIGIGEGLRAVIGRGESGRRRGHLAALGVILRDDDGYRAAASSGSDEQGMPVGHGPPEGTAPDRGLRRLEGVGRHVVAHWLVWTILAVLAVVSNEAFDGLVRAESHVADDDLLVAGAVVTAAFVGSYVVARRDRRAFTS